MKRRLYASVVLIEVRFKKVSFENVFFPFNISSYKKWMKSCALNFDTVWFPRRMYVKEGKEIYLLFSFFSQVVFLSTECVEFGVWSASVSSPNLMMLAILIWTTDCSTYVTPNLVLNCWLKQQWLKFKTTKCLSCIWSNAMIYLLIIPNYY